MSLDRKTYEEMLEIIRANKRRGVYMLEGLTSVDISNYLRVTLHGKWDDND